MEQVYSFNPGAHTGPIMRYASLNMKKVSQFLRTGKIPWDWHL